jgi:lipoprotein signal peptidase
MTQKSFRLWLVILAISGAGLDQFTKYGVFRWLYQHPTHYDESRLTGSREVAPGWFRLYTQYTPVEEPDGPWLRKLNSDKVPRVNHGALFGLLNHHEGTANWLFAIVSIIAGIAIIGWSFRASATPDRLLCGALGLILGGTIGNLYDRLVFNGVRDFLYFYKIDWPVFNIADCCLVVGAALLLVQAFFPQPEPAKNGVSVAAEPLPAREVAATS